MTKLDNLEDMALRSIAPMQRVIEILAIRNGDDWHRQALRQLSAQPIKGRYLRFTDESIDDLLSRVPQTWTQQEIDQLHAAGGVKASTAKFMGLPLEDEKVLRVIEPFGDPEASWFDILAPRLAASKHLFSDVSRVAQLNQDGTDLISKQTGKPYARRGPSKRGDFSILIKRAGIDGQYHLYKHIAIFMLAREVDRPYWDNSKKTQNLTVDHVDENRENNLFHNLQLIPWRVNSLKRRANDAAQKKLTSWDKEASVRMAREMADPSTQKHQKVFEKPHSILSRALKS